MTSRTPPLTDIGKFYKQIEDFKEKLCKILKQYSKENEIIELNKYYDKLMGIKKVNVRTPIEFLYKYGVTKYVDNILTRDEGFFLEQVSHLEEKPPTMLVRHCHSEQEESVEMMNQTDLFFMSQIRQVWQNLSPNVRDNIWNYIQIIFILAEKVVGGNILNTRRDILIQEGRIKSN